MSVTRSIAVSLTVAAVLIAAACSGGGASGAQKVIKSVRSNDLTITLSNASGEIQSGDNELTLSFADASGKPFDVPAASLKFHMPEMNDMATLTTTDTPGRFHARVSIEVAGSWEAMISFQGKRGTEQATMSVNAK